MFHLGLVGVSHDVQDKIRTHLMKMVADDLKEMSTAKSLVNLRAVGHEARGKQQVLLSFGLISQSEFIQMGKELECDGKSLSDKIKETAKTTTVFPVLNRLKSGTRCDHCHGVATKIMTPASCKWCDKWFIGYYCNLCFAKRENELRASLHGINPKLASETETREFIPVETEIEPVTPSTPQDTVQSTNAPGYGEGLLE